MSNNFFLLPILLLLNFIFFYFLKYFSDLINIYDIPDKKRKFHKFPVPLIGGVIIMLNFVILILFSDLYIGSVFSIFIFSLIFFLIGFIDDKFNLLPSNKFFLNIFILLFFFSLNENLLIKELNFLNIDLKFNYFFSFFFSILCILLFVNSVNLFDGINLQSLIYCSVTLLFIYFKNITFIYIIPILFVLILLMYFNYNNKLFLGDSGIYLLSSFIAFNVLNLYSLNKQIVPEEIFIIMMVPGLDMFRLFIQRLLNKKNPFYGDRNHIHHLLLKKYGYKVTILVLLLLVTIPVMSTLLFKYAYIIVSYVIIYCLLIAKLHGKLSLK